MLGSMSDRNGRPRQRKREGEVNEKIKRVGGVEKWRERDGPERSSWL